MKEKKWISVIQEPPQHARILVTDGKIIHAGSYYVETGKFCLPSNLRFKEGGMYCDLQENYTHWMLAPYLP